MIGAIIGDIAGSAYEFSSIKTRDFPLMPMGSMYTDDSLMTIAIAQALNCAFESGASFQNSAIICMRSMAMRYPYPKGGYGYQFGKWLFSPHSNPYGSYGNGSAMRVSPCAEIASSLGMALELAGLSAEVTHNHPEGIKGAQAVAAAIYLARSGEDKGGIRRYIERNFYRLDKTIEEIRPSYSFDDTCQGTVPQAITAFLESYSFEDALRTAISLGGDSDTLADITCAIAWPFYARQGVDTTMSMLRSKALSMLDGDLRAAVIEWERRYC